MTDTRLQAYADFIVAYSIRVQLGDRVIIRGLTNAEPLLNELYRSVLQAGGHPFYSLRFPQTQELALKYGSQEQLSITSPVEQYMVENFDALIFIQSESNTHNFTRVDGRKRMLLQKAEQPLLVQVMGKTATGDFRWMSALYPTEAYAQDAEMSLMEYEDYLFSACLSDMKDPVGYWKKVETDQDDLIKRLGSIRELHVIGKATDLRIGIAGRKWINACSRQNLPDGEIHTGPEETKVDGYIAFSYPSLYKGKELKGIKLWFEKGKVVKAAAEKNEEYLHQVIDTDAGSSYLGEFAFGTNPMINEYTGQILIDEKMGGTIHLALGNGYPQTGSKNRSAVHWDLIFNARTATEVFGDGNCIFRNGKFLV